MPKETNLDETPLSNERKISVSKIENKILSKIYTLQESVKYSMEHICELQGELSTIAYLMFLIEKETQP